ncbi:MAG: tetratricopeptide repeat protein [candidate division Zixibacteria bacterium]|nr:tetratricopeptide repeat protein [candidate division Zixibacteria bacterium]MDH3937859.1 tetratricopeptide repeat protein [candidate division Zixibacteria bacterium]
MKNQPEHRAAYISSGLILALFAAATLIEIRLLWGFNFGAFLPSGAVGVGLTLGVLLMWSSLSLGIQGRLDGVSTIIADNRRLRLVVPLLLVLAIGALFKYYESSATLLGDAVLRLSQIDDGRLLLPTEMGDFFVHAILCRVFFIPNQFSAETCYNVVSVACGLFFVVGAWRLAAYMTARQSIQLFLILISSGMTVLFFGYIESYSILAAMLPFVLLQALKVVDGHGSAWKFLALYLVAGLVHAVAFFLFLGPVVLVFLLSHGSDDLKVARVNRSLSFLFISILCLGYLGRSMGWFGLERQLLGLVGREGFELALFTADHGWNLVNWVLLSGLPILFFLPILAVRKHSGAELNRRLLLAIWLAVPAGLFVVFFAPQLGGPRDWDLFSLPMFLISSAVLIGYIARPQRSIPPQVLPVLLVGAVSTFAFAYVNSSPVLSADRFAQVLQTTKFKNQIHEYTALMDHARKYPELTDRRLQYALQAWDQPPYKRVDSSFILNYLNWMTGYSSQDGHVPVDVPGFLKSESASRDRSLLLAVYYLRFGGDIDLLQTADHLEQRFDEDVKARLYAGILFMKTNRLDECLRNFEAAYQLDSNDVEVLTAYAGFQYQADNLQQTIILLDRAVELNPNSFQAHYSLAVALNDSGQLDLAVEHLSKARELAVGQSRRRKVEATWRTLTKTIQNRKK